MSKDTPEVGDVWEYMEDELLYIEKVIYIRENTYQCESILKDKYTGDIRFFFLPMFDTLQKHFTYLGKSKVNIDDLFKTENEE